MKQAATASVDFRMVDKTNFRCYQLGDGTVYYGEVAFVSKNDHGHLYQSMEEVPHEGDDKQVITVRHGYGI